MAETKKGNNTKEYKTILACDFQYIFYLFYLHVLKRLSRIRCYENYKINYSAFLYQSFFFPSCECKIRGADDESIKR